MTLVKSLHSGDPDVFQTCGLQVPDYLRVNYLQMPDHEWTACNRLMTAAKCKIIKKYECALHTMGQR
jgi:hypothetical protein